jgi:hypothetical protein
VPCDLPRRRTAFHPAARPLKTPDEPVDTADMAQLKRIGGMCLATLALSTAALVVGALSGGAGAGTPRPAPTTSLAAVNCTAAPAGVAIADWCPGR